MGSQAKRMLGSAMWLNKIHCCHGETGETATGALRKWNADRDSCSAPCWTRAEVERRQSRPLSVHLGAAARAAAAAAAAVAAAEEEAADTDAASGQEAKAIAPGTPFMSSPERAWYESRARQAERASIDVADPEGSLAHAVAAVELYMQARRLADSPADRKRIDANCKALLDRAERLKASAPASPDAASAQRAAAASTPLSSPPCPGSGRAGDAAEVPMSTRRLSTREKIILLEGAKLNGFLFKPWESAPQPNEFLLKDGDDLFVDAPTLPLSATQLQSFAGWKRPVEALAAFAPASDGKKEGMTPTMTRIGKIDLVQDMTSDCSVVASLCAGISRAERGHSKILRALLYPYDSKNEVPSISPSGKYVLRLYFNGCWRRVEIDDRLPTSSNPRVLYVIDRSNPALLWPALLEKAYLKVRGGYDFPGSNSGTDLAVMTGWIPQQVFLHDEDVEQDDLWKTLHVGFHDGTLLLTMGTGKLPRREQRLLGLAAEHDYAVLDMKELHDVKEMLLKNPWSNGDVWRGAAKRRPNLSQEASPSIASLKLEDGGVVDSNNDMTPGTFWMDFRSVFQHFENIYINWNPSIFAHRQDLHFTWEVTDADQSSSLFVANPQFSIRSGRSGRVWLLLNRHFRTGDYSTATDGKNGYISLYLFHKNGNRVISSDGAKIRGPFVDSPNTLVRFELSAGTACTAVVASQGLSPSKYNFSISAFSEMPLHLEEAPAKYDREQVVSAAWTRSTAGGNSDSRHYLKNPQFKMAVNSTSDIALILQIPASDKTQQPPEIHDIHVKILVIFTNGSRVTKLRPRDIVASSGDYRRGSAVAQCTLDRGSYTIVCSTFDPDQHVAFTLKLLSSSSQSINLTPLPSENSGRLSIASAPARFDSSTNRLLAPVTVSRFTKVIFILQPTTARLVHSSSLFKMTLEQGQGPYKTCLASSASLEDDFSNMSADIRIEDTDLQPDMHRSGTGGLWLVLERMAQVSSDRSSTEVLQVEMLTEERIELGDWGLGDG